MMGWIVMGAVGMAAGSSVSASCATVDYPTIAFRCDPGQTNNCPQTHFCCSDDPAAENGALPDYEGKNIAGGRTPYFSGINNAIGTQGLCVDRTQVPTGAGLLEANVRNCPIPCNPTWSAEEIDVVCGESRECCQTTPLEAEDCIFIDDQWRPIRGTDIGVPGDNGLPISEWWPADHATHQDPGGVGCNQLAKNDQSSPIFQDCVDQLGVADQRGFCLALQPGQSCAANRAQTCAELNGGG